MKSKLTLLIAFAGLLLFSSIDGNAQTPTLSGTKWVHSGSGTAGEKDEVPFTYTETLTFTSDSTFSSSYADSLGEVSDPKTGTYKYSHPTITITFKDVEKGEQAVFSGKIEGNSMTLSGEKFIKQ